MSDPSPRARRLRRFLQVALDLPEPLVSRIRGPTLRNDRGDALDPELQVLIRLEGALVRQELADKTVAQARRDLVGSVQVVETFARDLARTEDRYVDGVRVRIYVPRSARPASGWPVVVYLHGGGWAVGDLRSHDRFARRVAAEVRAVVVAVDYPLAPEHPYPEGADAALKVWRWVRAQVGALDGDPDRIGIAGDSAGGNLAAVTCLRLRDAGEPQPLFQWLIYPATDLRCVAPSYFSLGHGYLLTQESIQWYLAHYRADPLDPRASVLLEPDLGRLAPAILVTAGFDPLRDDGEQYAKQLIEAGVEVDDLRYPSLVHGFVAMDGVVRAADLANEAMFAAVRARTAPRRGTTGAVAGSVGAASGRT